MKFLQNTKNKKIVIQSLLVPIDKCNHRNRYSEESNYFNGKHQPNSLGQSNTISLSSLEKNYLSTFQNNKNKYKHKASKSNILNSYTHQDIQIKSAFYKKLCIKKNCKCQYHNKHKSSLPKFDYDSFKNKHSNNQSAFKLKTLNDQLIGHNDSQMKKHPFKKISRLKSLVQQTETYSTNKNIFEKILSQMNNSSFSSKINYEQAQKQYQEYIKKLKKKGLSQIDCHNLEFQKFLKTHYLCILKNPKTTKKIKSKKDIFKSNNSLSRSKNRSRLQSDSSDSNLSAFDSQCLQNCSEKNLSIKKKSLKKNNKMNTQVNFQNKVNKRERNKKNFQHLSQKERQQCQKLIKQLYGDLGFNILNQEDYQNLLEHQKQFFALLCSKLLDSDPNIVQQAKKALRRLSTSPLAIFEEIFKGIKKELKQGIQLQQYADRYQQVQKAIKFAFSYIQSNIQTSIKQKQETNGKQKLLIVKNINRKYANRGSVYLQNVLIENKNKRLKQLQQQSASTKHLANRKDSIRCKKSKFNLDDLSNKNKQFEQSHRSKQQLTYQQNLLSDRSNKHLDKIKDQHIVKQKALKKGQNLKKKNENKKFIKQIQDQIQKQNKFHLLTIKPQNQAQTQLYLKRRAQSRQRLRQIQSTKHKQFIQQLQRKQKDRQSSTLSEHQMKKNNVRSHFQRNKIFLKKMQITLTNSQLNDYAIHFQDDLLTKKRKIRIFKQMIAQQQIQDSQLYRDIKKYLKIYERNCQMIINKDKQQKQSKSSRNSKKYAKRCVLNSDLFFDYNYQLDDLDIKYDILEEKFIDLLKYDNKLKYYDIHQIPRQQQDYQSLVMKIPTKISEKKKCKTRHKNIWLPKDGNNLLENQYSNSQILLQKSFEEKCQAPLLNNFPQSNLEKQNDFQKSDSEQPDKVDKLKIKFLKRLQRYKKALKTCPDQS